MNNYFCLFLLVGFLSHSSAGPQHGNKQVVVNTGEQNGNGMCISSALAGGANVKVTLRQVHLPSDLPSDLNNLTLFVTVALYETQCGEKTCENPGSEVDVIKISEMVHDGKQNWKILDDDIHDTNWHTFATNFSGIYFVAIHVDVSYEGASNFTFSIAMKNPFGYLSLVDYPSMIVYSLLLVTYIIYAFYWLVSLLCSYKDIVRLHFWILAVILLGFMEKVFFVAEYGTANSGIDSPGIIYIAEGVSAAKRALARVLLIIVSEGFGTVKPRLGSTLTGIVVVGAVYFVVAFIDGTIRASKVTTDSHNLASFITYGILFLVDTGIAYWIFSAIIATRRALRVRKNTVKLSLYNHLGYALIAAIIASGVFMVWQIIALSRNGCAKNWREVWLMECFWHILFCFILFVIMIIWRPSANHLRFVYSQVHTDDPEVILDDQTPNKNFDTVTMRPISKEGVKPKVSSQEAEEDLQWVEENLPTTAIDKILPALLDSEEEVMTTRFESSKLH